MLLVVTNKADPHADELIRRLSSQNISVFRLNTEDFLRNYTMNLQVSFPEGWGGYIIDELGRELRLHELKVAWIRRPEYPFDSLDNEIAKFVNAEVRALLACLYAIPSIRFINETFDAARAKTKFQQLILAVQLGVHVPRTIMTNNPLEIAKFAENANGDILVKPIYTSNYSRNGSNHGILSKRLSRNELEEIVHLAKNAPTQVQDYIEKDFELRITVVDNEVFAVRIDPQKEESTRTDWRTNTLANPHFKFDLPENVVTFCKQFLTRQKLVYGAFDFIVDPNGVYYFLENNPSGQFLWLETQTGVEITEALLTYICSQF